VAGGLVALFDDVAVLARAAAASIDDVGAAAGRASMKAAGVVVDDTAVTPQYVQGLAAAREIPIIRKIALGSLRNKLLIILPAIMLLSEFLPILLTPILMLGGAYLCYEGAEKVWHKVTGHDDHTGAAGEALPDEKTIVSGAVRTDFILSAEIMVISLNEVAGEGFVSRLVILVVVAIGITILVYGVVGLIVKMDDAGLALSQRPGKRIAAFGQGMVRAMPKLLAVITVIGTAAMLWVGGHILLEGTEELGFHPLYDAVHTVEEAAAEATGALGGVVGWLVNTFFSALLGLAVGALIVLVLSLTLHRGGKHGDAGHGDAGNADAAHGDAGRGNAAHGNATPGNATPGTTAGGGPGSGSTASGSTASGSPGGSDAAR
jgi:uncharacterized protein